MTEVEDAALLRSGASLYPYPVAVACGRICRARNAAERLDAILKGAEVVSRYCATLALGSYVARTEDPTSEPAFAHLEKNLSFGDFLAIAQEVSGLEIPHPLRDHMRGPFVGKKGGAPAAAQALLALVNLRNELGHDLMGMTEAKALSVLAEGKPDVELQRTLAALKGILGFPLFLVEDQHVVKKRIIARRLLLMGESSDPIPHEIELREALEHTRAPYVGLRDAALSLYPFMLWDVAKEKAHFSLYLLHGIDSRAALFVTPQSDRLSSGTEDTEVLRKRLAGARAPVEPARLAGDRAFLQDWLDERQRREAIKRQETARIPWEELDPATLTWYAGHLEGGTGAEMDAIRRRIQDTLLFGRSDLTSDEQRQLVLLFGLDASVRNLLRRTALDCRAGSGGGGARWEERAEVTGNLLACLRTAVDFMSRHVGVGGVTLDGLRATAGTADYIALREALVNLFIHQDYADATAPGQVEITPKRALLFNPGRALVGTRGVAEGGKSQCRNPLLARALRLIGFAELAGSGLRAIHHAWRGARRRPPQMLSDEAGNTFTLILDWRELPENYDAFWKDRLGVKLSRDEATALTLAADDAGVTPESLAAYLGLTVDDAEGILGSLERNALAARAGRTFGAPEHLKALIRSKPS